jgi:glutathione synthase/RimK-type ligase-like ATP-grasp enzyme
MTQYFYTSEVYMNKVIKIWSHNPNSSSSKQLSLLLNQVRSDEEDGINFKAARLRHSNSSYVPRKGHVLINWGSSTFPEHLVSSEVLTLNPPDKVAVAVNKIETLRTLEGVCNIPEWTTDIEEVKSWLDEGREVVGRKFISSHSGRGIVFLDHIDQLLYDTFKLFTKYIPKKEEYRVHVVGGEVIDVRRKALRRGFDIPNRYIWKVRNSSNGFIYALDEGHNYPEEVLSLGVSAIEALQLDFGAVDIIWNQKKCMGYVLEVNTAPGLEGSTGTNYVSAICRLIQKRLINHLF